MANEHTGECLTPSACEFCLEFEKGWSAAGEALAKIKEFRGRLLEKSGRAFAAGNDGGAELYRDLAKELLPDEIEARKKLEEYARRAGNAA